jgi:hypothetical protein
MAPILPPLPWNDDSPTNEYLYLEKRIERLEKELKNYKRTDAPSILVEFLLASFPQTKRGNIIFWSIPICLTGLALFLF